MYPGHHHSREPFRVLSVFALSSPPCTLVRDATLTSADQRDVDFIQKWIFPGGFLPTVTYVVDSILQGSDARLVVDSISNIGPHYARTLREWCERFEATFDQRIVPALLADHPEMEPEDVDVFKRKWVCKSPALRGHNHKG